MIERLIEELQDLRKAKELLTEVWCYRPYTGKGMQEDMLRKLRDYFAFDDSE
jgi:hypothetical protein